MTSIDRNGINSANFAFTKFSEVALCSSPSLQWAQPFR